MWRKFFVGKVLIFAATTVYAVQCPVGYPDCCDDSINICKPVQIKKYYGVTSGWYCLGGNYPEYSAVDCNGGFSYFAAFDSATQAIDFAQGYEAAWIARNWGAGVCGPVDKRLIRPWEPVTGHPNGIVGWETYQDFVPLPGSPPGACNTPAWVGLQEYTVFAYERDECDAGFTMGRQSAVNWPGPKICKGPPIGRDKPLICPRPQDGAASGNPILTATGEKLETETDLSIQTGATQLAFTRVYRSTWDQTSRPGSGMDGYWFPGYAVAIVDTSVPTVMRVNAASGTSRVFEKSANSQFWKGIGHNDALEWNAQNIIYRRRDDDNTFEFLATGDRRLLSLTARGGEKTTYEYNAQGQLVGILAYTGARITLNYDGNGKLSNVVGPAGQSVSFLYSSGRLDQVAYADGTLKKYLYENSAFPNALTGIVDESSNRYATFVYGSVGQATVSMHAGEAFKYTVNYGRRDEALARVDIYDPLNYQRLYETNTV